MNQKGGRGTIKRGRSSGISGNQSSMTRKGSETWHWLSFPRARWNPGPGVAAQQYTVTTMYNIQQYCILSSRQYTVAQMVWEVNVGHEAKVWEFNNSSCLCKWHNSLMRSCLLFPLLRSEMMGRWESEMAGISTQSMARHRLKKIFKKDFRSTTLGLRCWSSLQTC